jgi:hypothetical protein
VADVLQLEQVDDLALDDGAMLALLVRRLAPVEPAGEEPRAQVTRPISRVSTACPEQGDVQKVPRAAPPVRRSPGCPPVEATRAGRMPLMQLKMLVCPRRWGR